MGALDWFKWEDANGGGFKLFYTIIGRKRLRKSWWRGGADTGEKEMTKVEIWIKLCCAVCGVISSPSSHEIPVKSTLPNNACAFYWRGRNGICRCAQSLRKCLGVIQDHLGSAWNGQNNTISKGWGIALHLGPLSRWPMAKVIFRWQEHSPDERETPQRSWRNVVSQPPLLLCQWSENRRPSQAWSNISREMFVLIRCFKATGRLVWWCHMALSVTQLRYLLSGSPSLGTTSTTG